MERTAYPVAIIVLVLLAGCGGAERAPSPVTPAPVPGDTATPNPSNTSSQITDLVANSTALSAAHQDHLHGNAYTLHKTLRIEYLNGSRIREITTRTRVAAQRDRYAVERIIVTPQGSKRIAVWSTGDQLYRALDYDNGTAYIVIPPDAYGTQNTGDLRPSPPGDQVKGLFEAFSPQVTDPLARNVPSEFGAQDAITIYWVESTTLVQPERLTTPGDRRPEHGRLRAIVSTPGVVHQYHLAYTTTLDGEPVRVTETARYTHVGSTTVKRPTWYETAAKRSRIEHRGSLG